MRKIDLADASFLFLEKRETPMHVAGLILGTLPENASQSAVTQGPSLLESLARHSPHRLVPHRGCAKGIMRDLCQSEPTGIE